MSKETNDWLPRGYMTDAAFDVLHDIRSNTMNRAIDVAKSRATKSKPNSPVTKADVLKACREVVAELQVAFGL